MGPNGQAQYWARDLAEACQVLLRHYDHTYVLPGERFPRRAITRPDRARRVRVPSRRHAGGGFEVVGDVFSDERNPGRKKPFDIRKVMRAVSDQDHEPLERWPHMRDAENAVTWDAHVGGYPWRCSGSSRARCRVSGSSPPDGPDQFTSGTLFPHGVEEGGALHQCRQRRPAACHPGQPLGLRRVARVDAPSASSSGARRSDGRSSTSRGRSFSS